MLERANESFERVGQKNARLSTRCYASQLKEIVFMKLATVLRLMLAVFIAGCAAKALPPIQVKIPTRTIDYLKEVKPILDKRCTVCHSCYNSPCQLKLDSF